MVLGFSTSWNGEPTNFVEHVLSGRKWHTLRWGARWRPGATIQMATGVRTKNYRCFARSECLAVQGVKVIPGQMNPGTPSSFLPSVLVEHGPRNVLRRLAPFEVMALAINDGFDSAYDLNRWMLQSCRANNLEAFRGQLVIWAPLPGAREQNPTPY